MNSDLHSTFYGPILFTKGWPADSRVQLLPLVKGYYAKEDFGTILFQEMQTDQFLFRYFVFYFLKQMSLFSREKGEGLQSLFVKKGHIGYGLKRQKPQQMSEGQFTLLDAGYSETETIISAGRECHLFNVYYPEVSYSELPGFLPAFGKHLKTALKKPSFFLPSPCTARLPVKDAIEEILYEEYVAELQKIQWQLNLKKSLITQLSQTYTEPILKPVNLTEKDIARKALHFIQHDIRVHHTNDKIALEIGSSESSLKRIFKIEYGMGMYEYLMTLRMKRGRELLLNGFAVKVAAIEVGMRPQDFSEKFKEFYGYYASSLLKK